MGSNGTTIFSLQGIPDIHCTPQYRLWWWTWTIQKKKYDNEDEILTNTICDNANALQAAGAEIVFAGNASYTDHVCRLATLADHCDGDADANHFAGDWTEKSTCTDGGDCVGDCYALGDCNADVDAGNGRHAHRNTISDLHDDGESESDRDSDDDSDDHVSIAAARRAVDVVRHGFNDHDAVLDNDNNIITGPKALHNIAKFGGEPHLCLLRKSTRWHQIRSSTGNECDNRKRTLSPVRSIIFCIVGYTICWYENGPFSSLRWMEWSRSQRISKPFSEEPSILATDQWPSWMCVPFAENYDTNCMYTLTEKGSL